MRPYLINLSYKHSLKVTTTCNLDLFEINLIDLVVFH